MRRGFAPSAITVALQLSMLPDFAEAIFDLSPNQCSSAIEGQHGFHFLSAGWHHLHNGSANAWLHLLKLSPLYWFGSLIVPVIKQWFFKCCLKYILHSTIIKLKKFKWFLFLPYNFRKVQMSYHCCNLAVEETLDSAKLCFHVASMEAWCLAKNL